MVSLLGAAYAFGSNVTCLMNMMGESVNLSNFYHASWCLSKEFGAKLRWLWINTYTYHF
jgi:hypothetical protein